VSEKASFVNGLLVSKSTTTGGIIRYNRYSAVQGVPFPQELIYETNAKEIFSIRLEDTEVNTVFAAGAFEPKIDKLRIYPLSSLR
jgi:hypothetical protein